MQDEQVTINRRDSLEVNLFRTFLFKQNSSSRYNGVFYLFISSWFDQHMFMILIKVNNPTIIAKAINIIKETVTFLSASHKSLTAWTDHSLAFSFTWTLIASIPLTYTSEQSSASPLLENLNFPEGNGSSSISNRVLS